MSYTLEGSLSTISAYPDVRAKLVQIKAIGYRSGLEQLALYSTVRMRELKLVTSAFTRMVPLDTHADLREGPRVLFMALARYIKARIPILSALGSHTLYTRNGFLVFNLEATPLVSRYIRRYGAKLANETKSTAYISAGRDNYSLHLTNLPGRQADSYLILKVLPDIIKALETLTREVSFESNNLSDMVLELEPEAGDPAMDAIEEALRTSISAEVARRAARLAAFIPDTDEEVTFAPTDDLEGMA